MQLLYIYVGKLINLTDNIYIYNLYTVYRCYYL